MSPLALKALANARAKLFPDAAQEPAPVAPPTPAPRASASVDQFQQREGFRSAEDLARTLLIGASSVHTVESAVQRIRELAAKRNPGHAQGMLEFAKRLEEAHEQLSRASSNNPGGA